MSYFVEYLPYDGEITEGWVICIKNGEIRYCTKINSSNTFKDDGMISGKAPSSLCHFENYKPAKLFLCSKDIEVGDECLHLKYPEVGKWAIKEGSAEDCVDWHGENVDEADLYKIIGEISTGAIFVKEGMEFEEEEWELWGHHKDGFIVEKVEKDCLNEDWFQIDVCKIKCPTCKTFH